MRPGTRTESIVDSVRSIFYIARDPFAISRCRLLTGLEFQSSNLKIEESPTDRNEKQEPAVPVCCNSGCTVCVLDFPELFTATVTEPAATSASRADLLAMVEAIEAAEETAGRLLLSTPESD